MSLKILKKCKDGMPKSIQQGRDDINMKENM